MLKNYFKITFRNLWRNKGYSFINIFGLAVGLASCIIILLYVSHELSYDEHYENSDRIYRVASKVDFSGNYMQFASAPAPMGPALMEDYPEVEAMVRFRPYGSALVRRGEENFKEEDVVFADASLFDVFSIPVVHGDPNTALTEPFTIVISESMAEKYFGRSNAVGESLLLNDSNEYEVTAVYQDMPAASHFHFNFIRSMATLDEADNDVWVSHNFRTYILLKEGTDPEKFEQNFESVIKTYVEPQIRQFMGVGLEGFREAGNSIDYDLQPLTDIHLYSNLTGEFEANGSITYVYIFSGLAIFVLILACINFMNLATARSVKRAKEVGVRKTLGSVRAQLTGQFFSESIVFTIIALLIALLLVELSLPFFSELAGREIISGYMSSPELIGLIAIIVLSTGL
ncbi:MAG: ABC transporter permease, partial [Balneolaceae bacterium]|nr:ABC transporter permease [Balneolaceae bacterium]